MSRELGRAQKTLAFLAAGSVASISLLSCAAIVGVEDVRLRSNRDTGGAEEDVEEDDVAVPPDGGPAPPPNVLTVALGAEHSCARKTDGTVKCWGDDESGQLGVGGAFDGGFAGTPQAVNVKGAIAIASGAKHTCVVLGTGKVSCWGDNQFGQLGDGQTGRSNVPVEVASISDAKAVACGATFTCALRASAQVSCWGLGLAGQLGNGSATSSRAPVTVTALDSVSSIAAGEAHACAVKTDGSVLCWGDNQNGQIGTGQISIQVNTPTKVSALDGIEQVAAGNRSSCARKTNGGVLCWGANELGQLGSGAANVAPNPSPTAVSNVMASMIWAGADHACAVSKGAGEVFCWGKGALGQIGDGQPRDAGAPTPIPTKANGVTQAVSVSTGGDHSCAARSTGVILCWGANARGQLGNGAQGVELSPDSVVGF